jgi:hypothetical protein
MTEHPERSYFDPVNLTAREIAPHTLIQLRVAPMGYYVEARIVIDSMVAATGVGATLGDALMVAGALMTNTAIAPLHTRILRAAFGRFRL